MSHTNLSFADGLPETTKASEPGYHGFGLKSVRSIAQKYHGGVTAAAEDDIFKLCVYMMGE